MPRNTIKAQPLPNGSDLPYFELHNSMQAPVTSKDLLGENGTVVSFIHGTWCPYCIRQLVRMNAIAQDIFAMGVKIVCIAKDSTAAIFAYESSAQPALAFPILSDSTPSLSHKFGVYDPDHDSPYSAVFYASADGLIQYSDVSSDPDCYPNLARLLEVIEHGPGLPN